MRRSSLKSHGLLTTRCKTTPRMDLLLRAPLRSARLGLDRQPGTEGSARSRGAAGLTFWDVLAALVLFGLSATYARAACSRALFASRILSSTHQL